MKKIIFIFFILFCNLSFGQSFIVTPNGLRDAQDLEKSYVVIKVDSMTARQLYDNAMRYIAFNYKNPDNVIKSKVEGEYLKINTRGINICVIGKQTLVDGKYTTEISFKDGKVKYEIIELEMYTTDRYGDGGLTVNFIQSCSICSGIYNKKEILKEITGKIGIESYFNQEIKSFTKFLEGKDKTENKNW